MEQGPTVQGAVQTQNKKIEWKLCGAELHSKYKTGNHRWRQTDQQGSTRKEGDTAVGQGFPNSGSQETPR